MGFQNVAFLPSQASFYITFLKHCGKALVLPHFIILCLGVGKACSL